jgi:hypothetical protein
VQPKISWLMSLPFLSLTACPNVSQLVADKFQDSPADAPTPSATPIASSSITQRFSSDQGQNADLIITVDQSAHPQIDPADIADGSLVVEGRALNFPYRQIRIIRIEVRPELAGIVVERNQLGQMTVNFSLQNEDPTTGTMRIVARDLSACETRLANGAAVCFDDSAEQASFEQTQVFSWTMSPANSNTKLQTSLRRLNDGPISLRELVSHLPGQGGLYSEIDRILKNNFRDQSFSGGVSIKLAAFDSLFSQVKSERGQYPGYGFSGLSRGRMYGGEAGAQGQSSSEYYRGFGQRPTIGSAYQYELGLNDPMDSDRFERTANPAGQGAVQIWQVH